MFDSNRIKQDFSRAAAQYDDHALLQQRVLRNLLVRAKPLLVPGARILDAGCGTGQLARLLPEENITQMDISSLMCKKAAGNGKPAACGTLEALPFADSSFDMVFSSLVMQWLSDPRPALQEIKRVLKPDGVMAVSTFGEKTLSELRASFASVDSYPHVSPFITPDGVWHKETVTEYFPDFYAIIRHLKTIGANNKLAERRKAVMTRAAFRKVEDFYRIKFACESGFPVSWEVLYSVEKK